MRLNEPQKLSIEEARREWEQYNKPHEFKEDLYWEKRYRTQEMNYIMDHFGIESIDDVSETEIGKKEKYDFIIKFNGNEYKIEAKLTNYSLDLLALEYSSNTPMYEGISRASPGWMCRDRGSQADLLCYMQLKENKINRGVILKLKELKDWYWKHKKEFKVNESPNVNYKTHFSLVPLIIIPKEFFL